MSDKVTTVAIAIFAACGERPEHQGDARGNSFRWQDYLPIAEKAIAAMDSAKDAEMQDIRKEIAELRVKLAASEASDAESIAMYRKARDERDEARELCERAKREAVEAREKVASCEACVRRLYEALLAVAQGHAWRSFGECRSFDHFGSAPILSAEDADYAARQALADTPEHLRT